MACEESRRIARRQQLDERIVETLVCTTPSSNWRDASPPVSSGPGGTGMNRKSTWTVGIAVAGLAVLSSLALSAENKYDAKVPGGLAMSEFKGYEGWQAISLSRNERVVAIILGNPAMMEAYRAGIPANGRPVPDGAV